MRSHYQQPTSNQKHQSTMPLLWAQFMLVNGTSESDSAVKYGILTTECAQAVWPGSQSRCTRIQRTLLMLASRGPTGVCSV
jgi:hypothetical protein